MYFQFDDIQFRGLFGPSAMGYKFESRIAETPLILGKSSVLKFGDELDKYKLDLNLHYSFVNVPLAIESLNTKRREGRICAFVDGNGVILGDFFIKSLEIGDIMRSPNGGELLSADLTMELIEYVEIDGSDPDRVRAFESAKALGENGVTPVALEAIPGSDSAEIMEGVLETVTLARAADADMKLIVTTPDGEKGPIFTRIASATKTVTAKARKVINIIDRGRATVGQIALLREQLSDVEQIANTIRDAAERGDLGGVNAASGELLGQADSAFSSTQPINRLLILRRL